MTVKCLPVRAGDEMLIIPMEYVDNVLHLEAQSPEPTEDDEPTLPLLDVGRWVGGQSANRFVVVVTDMRNKLCLLVDQVFPARNVDAYTLMPAALRQLDTPYSALLMAEDGPLPVLDVPRLVKTAHLEV